MGMPKTKEMTTQAHAEAVPGSLKAQVQVLLRRLGIYHRLKSSYLYDLYWGLADRKLVENRRKELEFYRRTLRGLQAGDLIFDIGANVGQKTDIFLKLGARVVAVEPDPLNQEVLRQSYLDFRLAKKSVVIVGKAVGAHAGPQKMWVDKPGSAKNTLSPKWVEILRTDQSRFGESLDFSEAREVEMVTLEELIKHYGVPFYVKIDVEGYEPDVLSGLHTPISFVSFEVNLPQFKPEALECIGHLERLAQGGRYNYAPDCLRGLAFEHWLSKEAFVSILDSCNDSSIEVFWKAPDAAG
jgi:FkbM family methyltransferase